MKEKIKSNTTEASSSGWRRAAALSDSEELQRVAGETAGIKVALTARYSVSWMSASPFPVCKKLTEPCFLFLPPGNSPGKVK